MGSVETGASGPLFLWLGIRHHGPGSAYRALRALEAFEPDVLLVEGVEESVGLLAAVLEEEMVPPVAMLLYPKGDLSQCVYYPFAEFSPEWQALRYALSRGDCEVVLMDLPLSYGWDSGAVESNLGEDPIGFLASCSGYEDAERWWEVHLEQLEGDLGIFEQLSLLMRDLRTWSGVSDLDKRREAYMRLCLRKAIKQGYKKIAVLCGAWHLPALEDYALYKLGEDKALVGKGGRGKWQAVWIPWSYERLSRGGGYGAGVVSPMWNELLWRHRPDAALHWLGLAARALRDLDLGEGAASTLEALRLSEALATLRGLAMPSLMELKEACLTVLCQGSEARWLSLEPFCWTGRRLGQLPTKLLRLPLQMDFEQEIKTLRLLGYQTERGYLKATKTKPKGGLDLRQAFDRRQSEFLHRLDLLDFPWAKYVEATGRELSTKNEYWYLEWKPEYHLNLLELGRYGPTIVSAVEQLLLQKLRGEVQPLVLVGYLQSLLRANLPELLDRVLERLDQILALSVDWAALLEILPNLLRLAFQGDVRQTDTERVGLIVARLLPRLSVNLGGALRRANLERSRSYAKWIGQIQRSLRALGKVDWLELWEGELKRCAEDRGLTPLLLGSLHRLGFDYAWFDVVQTQLALALACSPLQAPLHTAQWLEGFLSGRTELLLLQQGLLPLIHRWLCGLSSEHFIQILPLLRRSFAKSSRAQRQQMARQVFQPPPLFLPDDNLDLGRAAVLRQAWQAFLGLT